MAKSQQSVLTCSVDEKDIKRGFTYTCIMQLMMMEKPEEHPPKRKENNHSDTEGGMTATTTKSTVRRWEDIPHDILELVLLKHFQPIEYANILRVCKSWGKLKPPPCFPHIVFHDNNQKVMRVDDELCLSKHCIGSYHGWLIIRLFTKNKDADKNLDMEFYFLTNVFTKSTMQLPWLDRTTKYPIIFFSSAPTDPDCTFLMLDDSFPTFLYCNMRCNKWIESDLEYPLYSREPPNYRNYLYTAISLGGKFYVLSSQNDLVAIDINVAAASLPNAAAISVLPVTNIAKKRAMADDCFLVESLGELLMVTCYRQKDMIITKLDVHRLDFKTMSWIEMKSLPGDQVLFIGRDCCFSISASEIWGDSNNVADDIDFNTMSWIKMKSLPGDQGLFLGRDCSLSIAASEIWGVSNNSSGEGRGGGGKYIYVADDYGGDTGRYDMHSQEMLLSTVFPSNYYSGLEDDKKPCVEMFWVRPPTAFVQ